MLSLRLLLTFDKLTLLSLSISLSRLLLFFFLFGALRLLLLVVLFVIVGGVEPADELVKEWTDGALSLTLEKNAITVEFQTFGMPFNEELIIKKLVVVELFAKCGSEFLHVRVHVGEELAGSLEEMLAAHVLLLSDQLVEDWLEGVPVNNDVSVWAEDAAHRDVHLVLTGDVELELKLADFSEDVVRAARACIRLLLGNEVFEFLTCIH